MIAFITIKKQTTKMKNLFTAGIILVIIQLAFADLAKAQLTSLPSGGNKRASVSESIGITNVAITYSRPAVKKRDDHIWGGLIPVGYVDQGFGPSKQAPWRAGANENTTIEFSTDVKIEGQALAAGKYGFFIAYDPNECTLIFSKNSTSWGSFFYRPDEDVLRVKVKPVSADKSMEWLKYEFTDQTPSSAVVALQWEKLVIPFKIDVDVAEAQLASFRKELRSEKGFSWEAWDQAAQYCAQNKTNLDEALMWADTATSANFGGDKSFTAWSTKATVLDAMGKSTEAADVMKKAYPYGNMNELYFYARNLTRMKKGQQAFDVFKIDYDKFPNQFLTNAGMARGYSAIGDYKKALSYALKAQAQAPDTANKNIVDTMVKKLQDGQDIN
jgi:tetratricopeptide (TPR) repeat protein